MKKLEKVQRCLPEFSDFHRLASVIVHEVCSQEEDVKDGKVMKKAIVKTEDPVENMSGIRVSDFSMENMIATGAVQNLKPLKMIGDVDESIANIEKAGEMFDYEMDVQATEAELSSENK